MQSDRRPADREAQDRRARERLIWWMRLAAMTFTLVQTVLSPGDITWVSWAVAAGFAASVAATGTALLRDASVRSLRRVGWASMVVDCGVVVSVLANNLTDPAEPVYLVGTLAVLEATMRWPARGGGISGVAAGVAAGGWTTVVYARIGQPVEVSFATMRAGVFVLLGFAFGALTRRLSEQRHVLQRILDTSQDLIVTVDRHGHVEAANAACREVLGYSPEEVVGRPWRDFLDPDQPGDVLESRLIGPDGPGEEAATTQRRFVCADGTIVWLELSVSGDAVLGKYYAAGRDVTERLAAERLLKSSEQRFRSLFDHNPDAVYAFDVAGRFTSANSATERLSGYTVDELSGAGFSSLVAPEHMCRTTECFERAVAGEAQNYETVIVARDGSRIELDVSNLPIVVDGRVVGVFGVAKDVTERRRLERALAHQARHDGLTGLPNRIHLEEVLETSLGSPTHTTLLFVDLDRFKVVNDSLGHRSGDDLLVGVADRLGLCLRADDLLVRWAGDEFCVLLANETSEAESLAIADRLLAAVVEPFTVEGRDIHVSASIGVAHALPGDTPARVLQMADTAMYEAKRAGRNRLAVFDRAFGTAPANAVDYEIELRHAVEAELLTLEYQPIVEIDTGRILAVESLLRWRRDDGTKAPPEEFIVVAEECGLIRDITRWVLHRACAQLAEWDRAGAVRPLQIWVNISGLDLQDPGLVPNVAAALEESSIDRHRLVLEVTESTLLFDLEQVDRTVDALHELGVALAIDDFGTGYSSMTRLHRLRVAACKIDREFVANAPSNEQDAAVIRSLSDLGGVFGFGVVGEGVETEEQLQVLRSVGCTVAQGFLFARPSPPDVVEPWLAAGYLPEAGTGPGTRGAARRVPSAR